MHWMHVLVQIKYLQLFSDFKIISYPQNIKKLLQDLAVTNMLIRFDGDSQRIFSFSYICLIMKHLYQFSKATLTNNQTLSSSKQLKFILFSSGGQKAKIKVSAKVGFSGRSEGKFIHPALLLQLRVATCKPWHFVVYRYITLIFACIVTWPSPLTVTPCPKSLSVFLL